MLKMFDIKAPLQCWEPQICQKFDSKISLKMYHNAKEDANLKSQFCKQFPPKNVTEDKYWLKNT